MSPRLAPRVLAAALAAVFIVGVAACEKDGPPTPNDPPAPKPSSVVVTVALPSLASVAVGVRGFVNTVKPGMGLMLSDGMIGSGLAGAVGATSLDGFDPAAPLHLVVLDGAAGGIAGAVLLGKVADRPKLDAAKGQATLDVAGDWAALGSAAAVAAVAPWARATLVKGPTPTRATAEIEVARLFELHGPQLEAITGQLAAMPGAGEFMKLYVDGLRSIAGDTARATVRLELDARAAVLELALAGRPGTRLAAFADAQRASDFGLIARLPALTGAGAFGAGDFALGPYRETWFQLLGQVMKVGPLTDAFRKFAELGTGGFAATFAIGPGGMNFVGLYDMTDGAAADRLVHEVAIGLKDGTTSEAFGIRSTYVGVPEVGRHDDVVIRGVTTTIDTSTIAPAQRATLAAMYPDPQRTEFAVVDDVLVYAMNGQVAPAIDAARGKGARFVLVPTVASAVEAAKTRKDSFVMFMDLGAITRLGLASMGRSMAAPSAADAAPMQIALGGGGGTVRTRIEIPAAAIAAVASAPPAPTTTTPVLPPTATP